MILCICIDDLSFLFHIYVYIYIYHYIYIFICNVEGFGTFIIHTFGFFLLHPRCHVNQFTNLKCWTVIPCDPAIIAPCLYVMLLFSVWAMHNAYNDTQNRICVYTNIIDYMLPSYVYMVYKNINICNHNIYI